MACPLAELSRKLDDRIADMKRRLEYLNKSGLENDEFFDEERNAKLKQELMQNRDYKNLLDEYVGLYTKKISVTEQEPYRRFIQQTNIIHEDMQQEAELKKNCSPFVDDVIEKIETFSSWISQYLESFKKNLADTEVKDDLKEFVTGEGIQADETNLSRMIELSMQRYRDTIPPLRSEVEKNEAELSKLPEDLLLKKGQESESDDGSDDESDDGSGYQSPDEPDSIDYTQWRGTGQSAFNFIKKSLTEAGIGYVPFAQLADELQFIEPALKELAYAQAYISGAQLVELLQKKITELDNGYNIEEIGNLLTVLKDFLEQDVKKRPGPDPCQSALQYLRAQSEMLQALLNDNDATAPDPIDLQTEISNLKQQLRAKEADIERLRATCTPQPSSPQSSDCTNIQEQLQQCDEQLEQSQEQIAQLQAALSRLSDQLQSQAGAEGTSSLRDQIQALQDQLDATNNQLDYQKNINVQNRQVIEDFRSENVILKKEIEIYKKSNQIQTTSIKETDQQCQQAIQENQTLKTTNKKLKQQIKSEKARIIQLVYKLEEEREKCAAAKASNKDWQVKFDRKKDIIDKKNQEILEIKEQAEALFNEKKTEFEDKLYNLRSQNARLDRLLQQSSGETAAIKELLVQTQNALKRSESTSQTRIKNLEVGREEDRERIERKNAEIQEYREQIQQLIRDNDTTKKESNARLQQEQQRIQELQQELQTQAANESRVPYLEELLKASEQKKEQLEGEIQRLLSFEESVKTIQAQLAELLQQLKRSRERMNAASQQARAWRLRGAPDHEWAGIEAALFAAAAA